jgi:peptide/nickel transport system substrate-binding protein
MQGNQIKNNMRGSILKMKKILFVIFGILLIASLVLSGCGKTTTATSTATTTATTTATSTATTTTTTTAITSSTPTATTSTPAVTKGGTLRIIGSAIPKDLGYPPEKAPSDNFQMLPVIQHLCEWGSTSGELVPVLATSWEANHVANTITWHFRSGIKFVDGTDFNAEAVRWNVQLAIDNRSGTGTNLIASMEVTDTLTLVMHMISFDWQTVQNLGLTSPISPASFMTAGGSLSADDNSAEAADARKVWARAHCVGTGAFTVSEWVRDDHITFVKNPNYWEPGKPYLDKIIVTAIADSMVASAKLQAGEADMWADTSSMNDILQLKQKNFKLVEGPGMFMVMLFSDVDVNSPLHIKEVRQAITYALDRKTMADTLGQGMFEPLTQMAPSKSPGYNAGYDPYPYSVDKAKALLKTAGYASGFKLKILGSSGGSTNDAMALFQYDLGLVGITVEPDIADLGRYFGALFGGAKGGWDGLCYTASGINPDGSDLFVHYGPNPMTFRTPNIFKSQAFIDLCNAAIDPKYSSAVEAAPAIKAALKQADEDALYVPLWRTYEASVVWPYVHTEYPKIHGIIWHPESDWMDAH